MLGIGAAWYDREHAGLGVPFPSTRERFERLEETLQICRQMWSDDDGAYDGTHFQLAETVCVPPPVQQPHPPILIGGSGEQKTLRMVAQYADACNLFGESPDVVRHKLEVLRGHCDDLGRDYDAIEKTMIAMADPVADTDGFLSSMGEYAALGISLITLMPPTDDPVGLDDRRVRGRAAAAGRGLSWPSVLVGCPGRDAARADPWSTAQRTARVRLSTPVSGTPCGGGVLTVLMRM